MFTLPTNMSVPEDRALRMKNGQLMPAVGLGTLAPKESEDDVINAVKSAVRTGYRHIDCAAIHRNERAVGHAIKHLIVEGVVTREDLFITSKLWNTCHEADLVRPSLRKTLEDLGLKYLDVYLMQWPIAYKEGGELIPWDEENPGKVLYSDVDFLETWRALEDCVDEGLAHNIGIANFNSSQIQRILDEARIGPRLVQIEANCRNTNRKLIEFCKSKGLPVNAYSPLGNPGFTKEGTTRLLDEPVVKAIAAKKQKSPAQICLRFLVEQGLAVVPKSITPSRIAENIQIFDFELTNEEMKQLHGLNVNLRGYAEKIAQDHKYYPFHDEF